MKPRIAHALSVLVLCVVVAKPAMAVEYAQNLEVTDAGVRNIGSSSAYLMQREVAKQLPLGNSTALLNAVNRNLLPERAAAVRRQFRLSIHEKTMFSQSRNRWIAFSVTKEKCEDAAKPVALLVFHLDNAVRR